MRRAGESLWVIVLVALLLRLVVVLFLYPELLDPQRDHWPYGYETGRVARSIATGKGFSSPFFEDTGPTALIPPVYVHFVAGVFKVLGAYSKASAITILSLNGLFSALTCIPIFFAARECFGLQVGVRAAWAWAFFPYAIYVSSYFIWETCWSTLLLTTLLLATLHLERARSLWRWAGYGLFWGFTALSSPAALSAMPPLIAWACYRLYRERRAWFLPAAVSVLALLVTLTPWTVRNYRTFHQFIPMRDNFWLEMWVGNNGDTSDWYVASVHPAYNPRELEQFDRLGEIGYMNAKSTQVIPFLKAHPSTYVSMILKRFVFLWTGYWSLDRNYLAENRLDLPNIFFSVGLTTLMLLGLRRAFRETPGLALPLALAVLFYPMTYYLTHAALYYRHPVDPEIVAFAVLGWPKVFQTRSMQ